MLCEERYGKKNEVNGKNNEGGDWDEEEDKYGGTVNISVSKDASQETQNNALSVANKSGQRNTWAPVIVFIMSSILTLFFFFDLTFPDDGQSFNFAYKGFSYAGSTSLGIMVFSIIWCIVNVASSSTNIEIK